MTGADEQISEEARLLAERVRLRAQAMPGEGELAGMTAEALSKTGGPMTPEQIRAIAAKALAQARQVTALLDQLAELLERPGEI